MKLPNKNVVYFDDENRKCIFTDIIEYKGTEQVKFIIQYGYPLKTKIKTEVISEHKLYDFLEQFTLENKKQAKLIKQEMENLPEKTNVASENFKELRATLFETLKGIKDGSLDVAKAKAISETSQTIINTIKVELDFIKHVTK